MKIGFIGLGIMGSRMAANLQANGHQLVIYNRSRDKAAGLLEGSAIWADTPEALASQVDILLTMLADPKAVTALAIGETGFLAALPTNALWIDCSTVNPSFSRDMAELARQHHIRFLDAPVAGSKNQAANAELIFIVGGAADDLQAATPILEKMGQRIVHVGENGMGTALKIVLNMQLAISMAAFAEGVALGRSLGIAEDLLLNVLLGGAVAAPFLSGKRDRFIKQEYHDPDFPLQLMHKDIHLATVTAYETETSVLLASATKQLFGQALSHYRNDDFSALYAYLDPTKLVF